MWEPKHEMNTKALVQTLSSQKQVTKVATEALPSPAVAHPLVALNHVCTRRLFMSDHSNT